MNRVSGPQCDAAPCHQTQDALRDIAKSQLKSAMSTDPNLPPESRHLYRLEAETLLAAGLAALELEGPPEVGAGGELAADFDGEMGSHYRDTVRNPDWVTAKACQERLELATGVGALELGVDAAETAQAQNSLEKMLCHQMAGAHAMAMRLLNQALEGPPGLSHPNPGITAKLVNTAARLMNTYQTGLLTLHKIRTGGRQHVTVQHQHVHVEGGQAVVANKIGPPQKGGG